MKKRTYTFSQNSLLKTGPAKENYDTGTGSPMYALISTIASAGENQV